MCAASLSKVGQQFKKRNAVADSSVLVFTGIFTDMGLSLKNNSFGQWSTRSSSS
jgi:hypothetical protein